MEKEIRISMKTLHLLIGMGDQEAKDLFRYFGSDSSGLFVYRFGWNPYDDIHHLYISFVDVE